MSAREQPPAATGPGDAVGVAVVGGGVVGLAVAAALARAGHAVALLEREGGFARGVTSRNSQVVHAGIYYAPGSEKARLCVRGRELLYERCARLGIPHRALGKLVVATGDAERRVLEELLARGRANGAPGLEILDGAALARLEPCVRGRAALFSPRTGSWTPGPSPSPSPRRPRRRARFSCPGRRSWRSSARGRATPCARVAPPGRPSRSALARW